MLCCVSAGGTATKVGGGGEPAVGPAPGAAASLTSGGTCRGAMASARKRRSGERPRAGQRGKGTGRTPWRGRTQLLRVVRANPVTGGNGGAGAPRQTPRVPVGPRRLTPAQPYATMGDGWHGPPGRATPGVFGGRSGGNARWLVPAPESPNCPARAPGRAARP